MTHVCEELQLGIHGLFCKPSLHDNGAIDVDEEHYEQRYDDGREQKEHLLVVILRQIAVHLTVKHLEPVALLFHLVGLHEHGIHVVARDDGTFQMILTLIRLALKNVHRKLHDEVSARGIKV